MLGTKLGTLLHKDHMHTIETLQGLEEFLHAHRKPPPPDGALEALLNSLKDTLRAEVQKHFGFEEDHLFTVFTARGETGIVMMLTQEHRAILPLALEVADAAELAVTKGFDDGSWRAFKDSAEELIEREIFHIQKEEMGLLSAIAAVIDPATDAKLAETYVKVVG